MALAFSWLLRPYQRPISPEHGQTRDRAVEKRQLPQTAHAPLGPGQWVACDALHDEDVPDAMTLHLHADDLGLSHGINSGILTAIDHGFVTSVSVMVNGYATDEAVAAIAARPRLRVSLHLNLLEGYPVAPREDVPLLLGADGKLAASFAGLAVEWSVGGRAKRLSLAEQLRHELGAQIDTARRLFGDRLSPLRVDGHTHIHALPCVTDALLDVLPADDRVVVRVPAERFHRPVGGGLAGLTPSGLAKHALLRHLSRRLTRRLAARGHATGGAFVGVLNTGRMTPEAVAAGVAAQGVASSQNGEVLVHPGGAGAGEALFWDGRPELWRYYRSPWRARERETACDDSVGAVFGRPRGSAGPG